METTSVNTNIPNLNNVSQNSASNIGASAKSNETKSTNNTNEILQSSITLGKGDLAQNLKKVNDGIMVTSLAEKGMRRQTEILTDIKEDIRQNFQDRQIDIDKNQIKQEVLAKMDKFIEISDNLKYQNTSLLDARANPTIEISTMNQTIEIPTPPTKEIGEELVSILNRTDFSNQSFNEIVSKIDAAIEKMNKPRQEFTQTQRQLVENAKNTISDQVKDSMNRTQVQNKNYGVEATEFSKANINAVAGHLVASQANIPQSHGMRLLY